MHNAGEKQFNRTFFIKMILAGVKIEAEFKSIDDLACCKEYISYFEKPDFTVCASDEEIAVGNEEFWEQHNNHDTGNILGVESRIIFKKTVEKMIWYNTILMHGVVVAKDGYAYMFTASSGVGKTTRSNFWLELYPGSVVVNDDKPFIRVTDNSILACGTPWSGKEGRNTNTAVPLRAIFLLERSDKDKIESISLGKAFPDLLQQTYRSTDSFSLRKTIDLLKGLDGKVKIYRFQSTPTFESVRLAYETAKPENL